MEKVNQEESNTYSDFNGSFLRWNFRDRRALGVRARQKISKQQGAETLLAVKMRRNSGTSHCPLFIILLLTLAEISKTSI